MLNSKFQGSHRGNPVYAAASNLSHKVIIALTVQEIIDEQIPRKLV